MHAILFISLKNLHGHTLDTIMTPCDLNLISDVKVGNFISDLALVTCNMNYHSTTSLSTESVSFRQYPKIDMVKFCADLADSSFVNSPANTASALYDQNVSDLSSSVELHAPLITKKLKNFFLKSLQVGCQMIPVELNP